MCERTARQSWQQRDIAEVDDFDVTRWLDTRALDRGNPPGVDKYQRSLNETWTTPVEQSRSAKDKHRAAGHGTSRRTTRELGCLRLGRRRRGGLRAATTTRRAAAYSAMGW
jgi:hypothetical protein